MNNNNLFALQPQLALWLHRGVLSELTTKILFTVIFEIIFDVDLHNLLCRIIRGCCIKTLINIIVHISCIIPHLQLRKPLLHFVVFSTLKSLLSWMLFSTHHVEHYCLFHIKDFTKLHCIYNSSADGCKILKCHWI